ncbi:hypothetical protein ACQ4PT_024015 [Festuca glaucescens]
MGLSGIMRWWEEWQLRVLVLTSFFIQMFLYFSDMVRRFPTLRKLRVLVWIGYVGGDAVAIYALATLFNRQKETWGGESSALEVLVALYVFCKWWSGEKRLLVAAILLFVVGILRFAQKPWALKKASFNSMKVSHATRLPWAQREDPDEYLHTLEEYVQEAKERVQKTEVDSRSKIRGLLKFMVLDLSAPYSYRVAVLTFYLKLEHKLAYDMLQDYLRETFHTLYTRLGSMEGELGACQLMLLPFLGLASIVIFATSRKDGHNEKDIMVTYILLCCTTMPEFFPICWAACSSLPHAGFILKKHMEGWHGMVSQYNLMSFCVRKKKPTFLMKFATFKFLRDFVNQHWYTQQIHIAYEITGLVRQHVKDGWNEPIRDAASYRRFNELQGQGL